MPTLLQGNGKPDLFYSFSGGLVVEQASQGVLRDITDYTAQNGCADMHSEGGKSGLFGRRQRSTASRCIASNVALWYNKRLAAEAGIDPTQIETWDDFLGQVQAAKDAGQVPILIGAKDKWPVDVLP